MSVLLLFVSLTTSPARAAMATPATPRVDLKASCLSLASEDPAAVERERNHLLATPELSSRVREGLRSSAEREAAVCVASRMGLKELLPDLVALAETPASASAELWSGLVKLSDVSHQAQMGPLARKWLFEKNTAGNLLRRIGALGILSKVDAPLKAPELLRLLGDDRHEIKLAAFNHFARHSDRYVPAETRQIFHTALSGKPYQLRLAALQFYRGLPPPQRKTLRDELQLCAQDSFKEVREACHD